MTEMSPATRITHSLSEWYKRVELTSIKIGPRWFNVELSFKDNDRKAAWELYIEMMTRVIVQPLPSEWGDERTALDSIYSLFKTTRKVLRQGGRDTTEISKVVIPVLNQVVRPFTTKWHKESLTGTFSDEDKREEFRDDLRELQKNMRKYSQMLAEIAEVEDLTDLEITGEERHA